MSLLHQLNCLSLGVGPLAILCHSKYGEHFVSIAALSGLFWFLSQLLQMVVIASFAPSEPPEVDLLYEVAMTAVRGIDFVAVSILIEQRRVKAFSRFPQAVSVGMMWCIGDLVLTKLLPLAEVASPEHNSEVLFTAATVNLTLLTETSFAAVVHTWLTSRQAEPFPPLLLTFRCALPSLVSTLSTTLALKSYQGLLLHAALALVFAAAALACCPRTSKKE